MADQIVRLGPEYFPRPTSGRPIAGGSIYIGEPDTDPEILTNQISVSALQENGSTVVIDQPILTGGGGVPLYNGSPVTLLVSESYSLKILDSFSAQIYYVPSTDVSVDAQDPIVEYIEDILGLINVSLPVDNQTHIVLSFFDGLNSGGGSFYWDSTIDKATANGGTIIDPDNIGGFDGTTSTLSAFLTAQDTGVGFGCWIRVFDQEAVIAWWGAVGDGTLSNSAMLSAVTSAWEYVLSAVKDLKFPAGTYQIADANFPWRQNTVTSLLDCGNITIFGEGPSTIFETTSVGGADVFQLNGLKNIHFKDLKIQAILTGSSISGSNGISVTNGYDNISILDVWMEDLPSLDKTTYVDGGKALTVQTPTAGELLETGSLKARIFVKGCAYGFDHGFDLVASLTKKKAIDIDIQAEDCYRGIVVNSPAATGAIPLGVTSGVTVNGQLINCQQDVGLNRVHGISVTAQVQTTKTSAERRLDPNDVAWIASDTIVEALSCVYAKDSNIIVTGNKGECDYKAEIGATTAGSSGLSGKTEFCNIDVDMGGISSIADIEVIDSGGNTTSECNFLLRGIIDATGTDLIRTDNSVSFNASEFIGALESNDLNVPRTGFAYEVFSADSADTHVSMIRQGGGAVGATAGYMNIRDSVTGTIYKVQLYV